MKKKLLAIVGPTAVGKTKLSIHLAKQYNGEIISGDSMQIYRGMDIGTAKVKPEEQEGIPHHLIDILEPHEDFSVSDFQALALQKIDRIHAMDKLPLLVGGTGLYVQSVTHHFQFSEVGGDKEVRERWEAYLQQHGAEALHQVLTMKDPEYAKELHPNNARRVIRALEVIDSTGQSMSAYQQDWDRTSPYQLVMIGLTMDRKVLYDRINQRVDQMIEEGLLEEVKRLLSLGLPPDTTALQAIGYKELILYIQGQMNLDEAIELLKRNSRRYAKRQLTWFRRMKEVTWFDVTDLSKWKENEEIIAQYVQESYSY
ncbi:tRNA (adenosine(37)-N6)-dimethylallyltransferase MiaA [Caldalkalibacillus mannanilyticus]|uniref:tRNA (adenosine(37)-N6)-dimethylallyltransferase MiaA n=1 Tax=Caldalkalibacillus mannanilyticus TaxID=1418 RepID=UPI000469BC30|nr:tRNA (adenosine(37)-N6)-dimethylallyltransferase MiaA [Caldalkalibacillus mannanilyticus]